ncbi:MAG: hypothetical protein IIZ39_00795 [Blautia sp.]|nr:hypothetical protein [Blautia sp.]
MNKKKRWLSLVGAAALLSLALPLGRAAWAAWQAAGQTVNLFSVAPFRIEIEEDYQDPGGVSPSQEVKKVVHVKNTGGADALVRVRVEVAFGHLGEDDSFIREDLDPSVAKLDFDDTGLWQRMEDGYYYYAEVLGAGEETKVPLLRSFSLSPDLPSIYQGKEGRIFVYAESIQAEGDARKSWGVSEKSFSWDYERALSQTEPVTVTFEGVKEGFTFEGSEEDIFAAFRYLTPGCTRMQRIEVSNDSFLSSQIFLCAKPLLPKDIQEGEEKQLKKLLSDYVYITLQDKTGELYRGPADGNLEGKKKGDTLYSPISLGQYLPGQKRHLVLSLAVSPEMEKTYARLLAKVRWEFSASGGTGEYPYTGDDTDFLLYLILAGGSVALVAMSVLGLRRKRKEA